MMTRKIHHRSDNLFRCLRLVAFPHRDLEVESGYMIALDKLVPHDDECGEVLSELNKYMSGHGVFSKMHGNKDRDRMNLNEW